MQDLSSIMLTEYDAPAIFMAQLEEDAPLLQTSYRFTIDDWGQGGNHSGDAE